MEHELPIWAQAGGFIGVIVSSVVLAVAGLKKKPKRNETEESQEALDYIRIYFKDFLEHHIRAERRRADQEESYHKTLKTISESLEVIAKAVKNRE